MNELSILALVFMSIFAMIPIIWTICWYKRRPYRIKQLQQYKARLERPDGCSDALEIFDDTEHVEQYYGYPLSKLGYSNTQALHKAAVESLERALRTASTDYDRAFQALHGSAATVDEKGTLARRVSALNDKCLTLRTKLVKLKYRISKWSDAQNDEIADRFVTS